MQFTTLSVAAFAALASAYQHAPQHFHHRRALNASSSDSGASTTLVVYTTNIQTITSCAATVTDCPARNSASAGVVVTEVVALTTTVCPVEQAQSLSSAILSTFATGAPTAPGSGPAPSATNSGNAGAATTPSASLPLGTGSSGSPSGGAGSPSAPESDVVLTYTQGTGSSTTVITTTIKHTITGTVYATKPAETGAGGNNAQVSASQEGTTTISGTETSTRYITVVAASSSASASAGSNNGGAGGASGSPSASASGSGPAGNNQAVATGTGSGSECPAAVTVTVALSTVTVTATPTPAVVSNPGGVNQAASPSASNVIIYSTASVVPLPVSTGAPYGNGTNPFVPGSTGFISKTKPTGTAPIPHATGY